MLKIGVIYGGTSTEHEISKMSAKSVIDNLDKDKYIIEKIFIDKKGKWYKDETEIDNIIHCLKELDVAFPVLHGLGGEDGTIQGMLEMLNIPYVGCKVLASSIGMDKVYTKIILDKANIPQVDSLYIKKQKDKYIMVSDEFNEENLSLSKINAKITFPMFVKPSNSGSSVGVKKVNNNDELMDAIKEASIYDNKILIERGIIGKEVECAVLERENIVASSVGEILSADDFYSYDAKYNNKESKTLIPARISDEQIKTIQKYAIKAFKAIDGCGLARVDFFVEDETNNIFLNEINTMPGFTNISMYPKLIENIGISYSELLSILINNALNK